MEFNFSLIALAWMPIPITSNSRALSSQPNFTSGALAPIHCLDKSIPAVASNALAALGSTSRK